MTKYSNKIGNIPDDWDFINANDCLIIESGMRPKEYVTDIDTHIPSLGGENIDDSGCLVFDNIRYIDPSYYKKMKKGHIKDDDIYINKDGANTGKVAFSKTKPFKECAVNEHVFLIRNDGTFKQQYLFYCLLSNLGKQQILKKIIGSAQEGINNSFTKGIILPKPSLPEQASIANILSKVDEAIESVKKSIEAAEKLKKSLMQNLLTGRMKPNGTLRKDDEFYVDEKFGKVPIGWDVKKLGNLFHIKAGGDLQEKFYSPIYDEQHKYPIFSNTIDNSGLYGYTSNPRFISKESLTIVGRGVGVGHVEYRKGNYDAIIRLISLIPKQEDTIDCMYVNYYICQYVHFAIESTGVPQLTCPKVFSTKIIIPKSVLEQSQIAEKIHCMDIDIKIKQTQITILERLKKSLMQNLLTGKVRVGEELCLHNQIRPII